MHMNVGMHLQQKQMMTLSPRMIQSMEILQLPVMALQERIEQELEENVLLERGATDAEETSDESNGEAERNDEEAQPVEVEERELVVDSDHNNEADFERRNVKMMYADPTDMHLLDQEHFNQYSIALGDIQEQLPYITEELEGMLALIYNEECVGLQVPTTIELKVTQCDLVDRGNSATGRTKPATLETGLTVHVPEYLAEGETIKVDSRTGEFIGRA